MFKKQKINSETLAPPRLGTSGFTRNSVSSGLNVVPNQTYVYLSARNIGNDEPINSATFTLTSQPASPTAGLEVLTDPTWVQFKPDVIGLGNFGATAEQFPKCISCRSNTKIFGSYGVDLSSGIYFYSFEANAVDGSNSFRQTKKMIFLK